MRHSAKTFFGHLFTENLSTKIIAIVITFILWILVLGRRDFVVSKDIDIEIKPPAAMSLMNQSADRVRVRVSGPRLALKKFREDSQVIYMNIQDFEEGVHDLDIPTHRLEIPVGVKILSIRPNRIRIELRKDN